MHKEIPGDDAGCSTHCCSGSGEAKSDQERVREVADTFYELARNESDGHYRGMLKGLLAASFIAGDDELLTHVERQMNQLDTDKQA